MNSLHVFSWIKVEEKYLMRQTELKDKLMLPKMLVNGWQTLRIWIKERPDFAVITGTMIAYPFYLLAVVTHKKFDPVMMKNCNNGFDRAHCGVLRYGNEKRSDWF